MARRWLAWALVLVLVTLSGCTVQSRLPIEEVPVSAPVATGPAAPSWQVGDWWAYSWSRQATDATTLHLPIRTVVAAESPLSWTLATDNQTHAAYHGAFVFPSLGEAAKIDLTVSVGELRTPWYRFPLQTGSTWQDVSVDRRGNGTAVTHALTLQVTNATEHRADIEVREAGRVVATYDYDEEVGWFTVAKFYDRTTGALVVQAELIGHGGGHKGTLYVDTGEQVVDTFAYISPTQGKAAGGPVTLFDLAPTHDLFLGFLFSESSTGAQDSELIDPAGRRYGVRDADINGQGMLPNARTLLVPGVEGRWRFSTSGASPFYSAGGLLGFGIHETQLTL